jgi:hypothetical protein
MRISSAIGKQVFLETRRDFQSDAMMTRSFIEKAEQDITGESVALRGLWYAANGRWDTAHQLVQDDPSSDCAWVHAYLHRVEGDIGNAHYWYRQAGKKPATDLSLEQELEEMIAALSG